MKTLSNFIVFIMVQPKERIIDNTGGWHQCAVGDFVRHTDKLAHDDYDFDIWDVRNALSVDEASLRSNEYDGALLINDFLGNWHGKKTYGDLQEKLTEDYPFYLGLIKKQM